MFFSFTMTTANEIAKCLEQKFTVQHCQGQCNWLSSLIQRLATTLKGEYSISVTNILSGLKTKYVRRRVIRVFCLLIGHSVPCNFCLITIDKFVKSLQRINKRFLMEHNLLCEELPRENKNGSRTRCIYMQYDTVHYCDVWHLTHCMAWYGSCMVHCVVMKAIHYL